MAVDPVPWLIENGASHSANVARNISFAAFGGNEGIVTTTAFEVRQLAAPAGAIQVYPGTIAIKNRAAGILDEMYVARAGTGTQINVAPTGGSVRADMVIAHVKNPWLGGEPWADPASNANGPYFFLEIISGVPATAKTMTEAGFSGYSAVPLARINIPASTTAITQAMITDLRELAQTRKQLDFAVDSPTSGTHTLTASAYARWPNSAGMDVEIPPWATHCKMRAFLGGIVYGSGGTSGATGFLRPKLVGNSTTMVGPGTAYNVSTSIGSDRTLVMLGAPIVAIPAANRGKAASMQIEGTKTSGATSLTADVYSTFSLEVEFYNAAESNL